MYLVSACLLGCPCRYDGQSKPNPVVAAFLADQAYVPVCPEQLGGLPIPRRPAEISGGDGVAVLRNAAIVHNTTGDDVTASFQRGALATLLLAQAHHCSNGAILKERSPSCGSSAIYDGSFTQRQRLGSGVTAALLRTYGVPIFSEENLPKPVDE